MGLAQGCQPLPLALHGRSVAQLWCVFQFHQSSRRLSFYSYFFFGAGKSFMSPLFFFRINTLTHGSRSGCVVTGVVLAQS